MSKTIIYNARIFGARGRLYDPGYLVIEDGYISQVGSGSAPQTGPGDLRLDSDRKYVFPGFIDAHVHMCYAHKGTRSATAQEALAAGRENARRTLATGVTTVRDVGAFEQLNILLKDEVDRGATLGPHMITSGDFISATGGHCFYWAEEVGTEKEIVRAVDRQVAAGADVIKLMVSGGAADPGEDPSVQQLSTGMIQEAISRASRWSVDVAAHAHPEGSILAAIQAGARTIEHGTYLSDVVCDELLSRDVWLVPTIAVYSRIASGVDGTTKGTQAIASQIWEEKIPRLRRAVDRGVRIGVGTDSGSNMPSGEYLAELKMLSMVGMDAEDIIIAATQGNSEMLGIGDTVGTIDVGMRADLAQYNQDPLKDLGNISAIDWVMKQGEMRTVKQIRSEVPNREVDND